MLQYDSPHTRRQIPKELSIPQRENVSKAIISNFVTFDTDLTKQKRKDYFTLIRKITLKCKLKIPKRKQPATPSS